MNLRGYYEKIREIERNIIESSVVVVSHETPDGGRAGRKTEVPRRLAAKMVVDGAAHLADTEETRDFRAVQANAAAEARRQAAAAKVQVTVVAASELEAMRRASEAAQE